MDKDKLLAEKLKEFQEMLPFKIDVQRCHEHLLKIHRTSLEYIIGVVCMNIAYLEVSANAFRPLVKLILIEFQMHFADQIAVFLRDVSEKKNTKQFEDAFIEYLQSAFTEEYIYLCVTNTVKKLNEAYIVDGILWTLPHDLREKLTEIFTETYNNYINFMKELSEKIANALKKDVIPYGTIQDSQSTRYWELKDKHEYKTDREIYEVVAREFNSTWKNIKSNVYQVNKGKKKKMEKHHERAKRRNEEVKRSKEY